MAKLRRAKLAVNNGSVVVYYSHKGILRFPAGVVISKVKVKGRYVDWNYKDNHIKTTVDDYYAKCTTIDRVLERTKRILNEYFELGDDLSAGELKRILESENSEKAAKRTNLLLDLYDDFYEQKKKSFSTRGSMASLKDYTSFRNMIIDYQAAHDIKLRIKDVDGNKKFLTSLLIWMRGKMPDKIRDHVMKTKGQLNDKTCRKRFDILLHFWKELYDEKKVADVKFIQKFINDEIRPISSDKVTLTVDEVHDLYEHQFEQLNHEKIRDLFVFACFTGLRWSDLEQFDPRFILPSEDGIGKVYRKTAGKTKLSSGKKFEIPLCDVVIQILNRYGGSLKPIMVSNVEANRRIKEVLEKTGMFDGITEITDKETGQYMRRWEAVTMHKARDTFISNLINTTPLNELMKYTAHTKLSTLQGYVDRRRPVSMQYINDAFNRKHHGKK